MSEPVTLHAKCAECGYKLSPKRLYMRVDGLIYCPLSCYDKALKRKYGHPEVRAAAHALLDKYE